MRVFTEASIYLRGDKDAAQRNVSLSRTLLGIMKSVNAPTNQVQRWRRVLPDGTRVDLSSIHGRDYIVIEGISGTARRYVGGIKYLFSGDDYFLPPPLFTGPMPFQPVRFENYVEGYEPSWDGAGNYYELNGNLILTPPGQVHGVARLSSGEYVLTLGTAGETGLWKRQPNNSFTRVVTSGQLFPSRSGQLISNLTLFSSPTVSISGFLTTTNTRSAFTAFSHNGNNKIAIVSASRCTLSRPGSSFSETGGQYAYTTYIYTINENTGDGALDLVEVNTSCVSFLYSEGVMPEPSSLFTGDLRNFHEQNVVFKLVSGQNPVNGYLSVAREGYEVKLYGEFTTTVILKSDGRIVRDVYFDEDTLHTVYTERLGVAKYNVISEISGDSPELVLKPTSSDYYFGFAQTGKNRQTPEAYFEEVALPTLESNQGGYDWVLVSVTALYPNPLGNIYQANIAETARPRTHRGSFEGVRKPDASELLPATATHEEDCPFYRGSSIPTLAGFSVYTEADGYVGVDINSSISPTATGVILESGAPSPFFLNDITDSSINTYRQLETAAYFMPENNPDNFKFKLKYLGTENTIETRLKTTNGFSTSLGVSSIPRYFTPAGTGIESAFIDQSAGVPVWENVSTVTGNNERLTSRSNVQDSQKSLVLYRDLFSVGASTATYEIPFSGVNTGKFIGHQLVGTAVQTYLDPFILQKETRISSINRIVSRGLTYVTSKIHSPLTYPASGVPVVWNNSEPSLSDRVFQDTTEVLTYNYDGNSYISEQDPAPPNNLRLPYVVTYFSTGNTTLTTGGEYSTQSPFRLENHFRLRIDQGLVGPNEELVYIASGAAGDTSLVSYFDIYKDGDLRAALFNTTRNPNDPTTKRQEVVRAIGGSFEKDPIDVPSDISNIASFYFSIEQ